MNHGIAIDISNYTGKLESWDLDWLEQNSQLVIVRLSTEDGSSQRDIAAQQVAALAARGKPWQGYLWAYWGLDPIVHWNLATEMLPPGWPGYYGRNIWIDMEDPPSRPGDALSWVAEYAWILEHEDFRPGVYTGQWWIGEQQGGFGPLRSAQWTRLPLWFASYNVPPSCAPSGTAPWNGVAMHQFESIDQGPVLAKYDRSLICNVE